MIISDNSKAELKEFSNLMKRTDALLNKDAADRQEYYLRRGGIPLEQDVYNALVETAIGTKFQGSIELVSGAIFPDIILDHCYGVEVKSTTSNHWTSTGSSILESTRNKDVERIYLTFGKLFSPVQFISRPYEECLSGIAVTHYPRYRIDMTLNEGETIFDKMGVPYDDLRKMDSPVGPVSKYYKSLLKPGESLWWSGADPETESVAPTVKLWTALPSEEKNKLVVLGYVLFPEVLEKGNPSKYNRYVLWLVTQKSVVNANVRDGFSAGGRVQLEDMDGNFHSMPAAFGRIKKYASLIEAELEDASEEVLKEYWKEKEIWSDRLSQWCGLVANAASSEIPYQVAWSVLTKIFRG